MQTIILFTLLASAFAAPAYIAPFTYSGVPSFTTRIDNPVTKIESGFPSVVYSSSQVVPSTYSSSHVVPSTFSTSHIVPSTYSSSHFVPSTFNGATYNIPTFNTAPIVYSAPAAYSSQKVYSAPAVSSVQRVFSAPASFSAPLVYSAPTVQTAPVKIDPIIFKNADVANTYSTQFIQPGYVAKTKGSEHYAPLPEGLGYASHHINLQDAPGTK